MIICKNFDKEKIIDNLDDWRSICPPASGDKQWKDSRSAKELAREWTKSRGAYLEKQIGLNKEFQGLNFKIAAPEYISKFDDHRGGRRQHDLLIHAEDNKGKVLISLEAKADESFGKYISKVYSTAMEKRINGISTNVPDRIEELLRNVFGRNISPDTCNLRYQLLYAIAGTVAEAKKRNIKRAIFSINTFSSQYKKTFSSRKHENNMKDLDLFIRALSNNSIKNISNNKLVGPFNTADSKYLSSKVDLYIMKTDIII